MDEQLLIHIYNVGVGDCIYLRVPEQVNGAVELRHIVIDCGTIDANRAVGEARLVHALTHIVEEMLPNSPGDPDHKQLDLLVVTHPHLDHYASFGIKATQALWDRVQVQRVWLTTLMGGDNDCAVEARKQVGLAEQALQGLQDKDLSPALGVLVRELFNLNGGQIAESAKSYLAELAGPPVFVHDQTPPGQLKLFVDDNIKLHVLAPTMDMDGEYLDKNAVRAFDASMAFAASLGKSADPMEWWRPLSEQEEKWLPISPGDFYRLRERMANIGARMAMASSEVVNNSSIVLLLEWYGRRLLFTGDAECKFTRNGAYNENGQNFSWNVMAKDHPDPLLNELDFLKVGHHGSHNASPFSAHNHGNKANEIMNSIAPLGGQRLQAVVSCARFASWPDDIPQRALLEMLGGRISNARETYDEWLEYGGVTGGNWPDTEEKRREILVATGVSQPPRTDLEHQHTGAEVVFIPVEIAPLVN